MQDESAKETGLTPDQQILLMGKVRALEEALAVVVRRLRRDEQDILRNLFRAGRDNQQATATIPAPYQAGFDVARYHVFDRLMLALADHPENDNEG